MTIVRHCIELLINPFCLAVVLLGFSLYLLWRKKQVISLLTIILVSLLLMSTGFLPSYLTHHLEKQYAVVETVDPKIQWIVVLGGGRGVSHGMPANDILTSASLKRLIEGVRLFRKLPNATLVLSGGGNTRQRSEAALLAQVADWFAIPKPQVVLEPDSINTADQAINLQSIVQDKPFYLVTSAAHMPRAMQLCTQQGLHPIPAPTDFTYFWTTDNWSKMLIPNGYNLSYFSIAMHELLGRLWSQITTISASLP